MSTEHCAYDSEMAQTSRVKKEHKTRWSYILYEILPNMTWLPVLWSTNSCTARQRAQRKHPSWNVDIRGYSIRPIKSSQCTFAWNRFETLSPVDLIGNQIIFKWNRYKMVISLANQTFMAVFTWNHFMDHLNFWSEVTLRNGRFWTNQIIQKLFSFSSDTPWGSIHIFWTSGGLSASLQFAMPLTWPRC